MYDYLLFIFWMFLFFFPFSFPLFNSLCFHALFICFLFDMAFQHGGTPWGFSAKLWENGRFFFPRAQFLTFLFYGQQHTLCKCPKSLFILAVPSANSFFFLFFKSFDVPSSWPKWAQNQHKWTKIGSDFPKSRHKSGPSPFELSNPCIK